MEFFYCSLESLSSVPEAEPMNSPKEVMMAVLGMSAAAFCYLVVTFDEVNLAKDGAGNWPGLPCLRGGTCQES